MINCSIKNILTLIKLNPLYSTNLKVQGRRILQFFLKGKTKNKNKITSPDGQFSLKKNMITYPKGKISLDKLIAAYSLNRSKIFEFLKSKGGPLEPYTESEKKFLKNFQLKLGLPPNSIPCATVRRLN